MASPWAAGQRGTVFLLLGMLAWILAGFVGAAFAIAVLMGGSILPRLLLGTAAMPEPSHIAIVLAGASGFQATLLFGAQWSGRRSSGDGRWNGLGVRPVLRKARIAGLCVATTVWLAGFIILMGMFPALRAFARSVTPDVLAGLGDGGPWIVAMRLGLVVFLAPVSEELFFRGWLWEALQRRGHAIATTALLTALPWLLLHGIDSPGRILFLLPAAAIFSLARHWGGGVLASLAAHMTNNLTAVTMQAIPVIFGYK
ncbi:MAG: CPBP family intramembrane metalloprotease [Acetobacteraceae bacterium]|nr:CPBP family intramembrane metalloprotease [Acetobacteraceae bacterium]